MVKAHGTRILDYIFKSLSVDIIFVQKDGFHFFNEFWMLCVLLQDALPFEEMNPAEVHCQMADVVLCLGTR